jgi:hypothetical protein
MAKANDVARAPRWYTLTGNCTTLVFGMIRLIRPGPHLDYRILLSGYLPDHAYDVGAADTSIPFDSLRHLARTPRQGGTGRCRPGLFYENSRGPADTALTPPDLWLRIG